MDRVSTEGMSTANHEPRGDLGDHRRANVLLTELDFTAPVPCTALLSCRYSPIFGEYTEALNISVDTRSAA